MIRLRLQHQILQQQAIDIEHRSRADRCAVCLVSRSSTGADPDRLRPHRRGCLPPAPRPAAVRSKVRETYLGLLFAQGIRHHALVTTPLLATAAIEADLPLRTRGMTATTRES